MSINPVFHARTKDIEMDYHFVRYKVAVGSLVTRYVPSREQVANIVTKPFSKLINKELRSKLGVHSLATTSLRHDDSQTHATSHISDQTQVAAHISDYTRADDADKFDAVKT